MTVKKSVMMVMSNVDGNNNKFWKAEIHEDHSYHVTNGRVGSNGQTQKPKYFASFELADRELEKKKREKIKKNYVEFDGVVEGQSKDLSGNKVALNINLLMFID